MVINKEKLEQGGIIWTETSRNSRLKDIKGFIEKHIGIKGLETLKELIENKKYQEFQLLLGLQGKNVDGKLGKFTLEKLYEYVLRQDIRGKFLNILTDKSDLKSIVWTETSKDSKLGEIKSFLESKSSDDFFKDLYDLILKKDYKGFQEKLGMVGKDCDGMLGKKTLKVLQDSDFSEKGGASEEVNTSRLEAVATDGTKEEKVENEDFYVEEVNISENTNIDYEHWNMSEDVKDYFNKGKFEKPFFEIDFDGKKMYLTKLQPVLGYGGFVGFIEVNGKYEIRYFIKSGSEQLWRCCPGYRDGGFVVSKLDEFNDGGLEPEIKEKYKNAGFNYTGNFSYERSTMVDFRIGQELERIYVNTVSRNGKYFNEFYDPEKNEIVWRNGHTNPDGGSLNFDNGMANRCIKMSREIDIIDDFSGLFGGKIRSYSIEEVKNIYRKETLGIDVDSLQLEGTKEYNYYHEQFKDVVDVEVCSAKMHGKDIEIFFSHLEKEPDLVWIDNIQYKNQPMNSYGIPAKQINAGRLTKKPIDYPTQCPEYDKLPRAGGKYKDYKDIRPLYQDNPLIKKYKELSRNKSA